MSEPTDAEMDLDKNFAQLLKDVSDELFHQNRKPETNALYAQRRMAAIFAKQAKEGLEISSSQLNILGGLKDLAEKQQRQADSAQEEIQTLNRWMLILTSLGVVFAAASLILTWVVAKGYVAPPPTADNAALMQKSGPDKETEQTIAPQLTPPISPPRNQD